MRRVYIEMGHRLEGAVTVNGKVIPGGTEIWFNPDTGAIFKKTAGGAYWGHLLQVLGHEHQLCEFQDPPAEKTLPELLKESQEKAQAIAAIEAAIPVAVVEAPEGMVNPPKTGKRGPYKKRAKQDD